jgi:hypothetical protein
MDYNKQFKLTAEAKYTLHFLSFQKLVISLQVKSKAKREDQNTAGLYLLYPMYVVRKGNNF